MLYILTLNIFYPMKFYKILEIKEDLKDEISYSEWDIISDEIINQIHEEMKRKQMYLNPHFNYHKPAYGEWDERLYDMWLDDISYVECDENWNIIWEAE